MTKRMLIDAVHAGETRVVIANDDKILDFDFVTTAKAQIKGNIYLAKITRVEPSLQAAFVEYGGNKQGFLPFAEIHPDYYQLPQADRQKLIEEQIAEAEAEEAEEEKFFEQQQRYNELIVGNPDGSDIQPEVEYVNAPDGEDAPSYALHDIPAAEIKSEPQDAVSWNAPESLQDLPEIEPIEHFSVDAFLPQDLPDTMMAEAGTELEDIPQAYDIPELPLEGEELAPIDTSVEVISGEDEALEASSSRKSSTRSIHRRYRIGEVIKRNQIILVQIIKEERGNKGASLTTYISLAGRYCVLMPNSPKGGGISRKITDGTTRRRLKEIASDLKTNRGMSVIIRTAGLDKSLGDIKRDYEYLTKLWNQVREQTLASTAPAAVYEEGNIIKRSIRDLYTSDIQEIIVDGDDAYREAKDFMAMLMPDNESFVKKHADQLPILAAHGIEEQMNAMNEPQVKLPSGGYLVIQQTEALISIDVNSGRSTSERNVEDTAIKTNLEAAAEVGRQLRLRDLAGLIVVDFIDMNYGKNRRLVERAMKDALKMDRAKIQLGRISSFGLMELSRQRMRPSISEAQGTICPHCKGTGFIQSVETVSIQIIRTLEREAVMGEFAQLRVSTYAEAALHLLNEKRSVLQSIEERFQVSIVITIDTAAITGNFRLVKVTAEGKEIIHDEGRDKHRRGNANGRKRGKRGGRNRFEADDSTQADDAEDSEETSDATQPSSREFSRDRGRDRDRGRNESSEGANGSSEHEESDGVSAEGGENERSRNRGRRERGRRGGRNRRGNREYASEATPVTAEGSDPQAVSESVPQENAASDVEGEPRERSPRRRSRGGRGRNRQDGSREPREPREHREPREPREPRTYTTSENEAQTASAPRSEPREASPTIISVQSSVHAPTHTPAPDTADPENGTKRRGWWSRVLEG